ncbi:PH domain-containing protein [Niveibacterium sp. 24ML]|uniref:PH domain-containing protein n=1 Tax=Niveibacterium sp. 24ML TaxID=2985512 RepID=UPI002271225C|nr:PH domain-containing protein [Niveibacterium sp. 24ML]MCX9156411.1 PH domain-containing protein [Niveibacterium sp. 24ML]
MASYIEGALTPGEAVIHVGRISLWSQAGTIALGFLLLPLFGIGLIFWIIAWIRSRSTELAITNKRVIAKFGFISRRTIEINLGKIESIQVDQTVLGRMLNYGSLVIAGAGEAQAPIPHISNPMRFRQMFMQAQEQLNNTAR